MRGLIVALQWLTRLPTPTLAQMEKRDMQAATIWYPSVGLLIGALLALAGWLGASISDTLAGLLIVIGWVAITGALHLDGAADLADALGAAHHQPARMHAVFKDPHIGSFGVVVLILILLTKWVAATQLLHAPNGYLALMLAPAWARLGALDWAKQLQPLNPSGSGAQLASAIDTTTIHGWRIALCLASWIAISFSYALAALLILWLWRHMLQQRVGGMNGDTLGAGIEYSESALLLVALL